MLEKIIPADAIITVSTTPRTTYIIPTYPNKGMVGQVCYNPINQRLEVYDGSQWIKLENDVATISASQELKEIVSWAQDKIKEEKQLISMPDDHPSVKSAKEEVNRAKELLIQAKEKLKVIEILSQNE
jgi:hypothetical protein